MHFSQIFGTFLLLSSSVLSQKQSIAPQPSGSSSPATDFTCPEDFGYFPHPSDCTQYYVCVFGGALLESCTGGLMYSHDLQTCDWPRNVYCYNGTVPVDNNIEQSSSSSSAASQGQDRSVASLRSRGSSSSRDAAATTSSRGNPSSSYSYNPIKIETYGQLSRAAEESISGGKKRVVLPDDEYQQQRSGRSYEGSLPNYKEEIYQQGRSIQESTTNCLTNASLISSSDNDKISIIRKKRSVSPLEKDLDSQHYDQGEEEFYEGEEDDNGAAVTTMPMHKLMRREAFKINFMKKDENVTLTRPRRHRSSTMGPSSSNPSRALFDPDYNTNSIQYFPPLNSGGGGSNSHSSNSKSKHNKKSSSSKASSSAGYSHRVSSPGNILYPPSYYQTPTYGLVNMDKLRNSISSSTSSTRLRNNNPFTSPSGPSIISSTSTEPPPAGQLPSSRVVKITTSKPPLGGGGGDDNTQTGSYYSSQRLPHQTILDYHAPNYNPSSTYQTPNNYHSHSDTTSSLLVNKHIKAAQQQHQQQQSTPIYSYTPQQQQRWNHVLSSHHHNSPTLPPGQPGYYNPNKHILSNDDKRIVLKTPGSPLSAPGSPAAVAAAASQSNNNLNNYEEKRLSDFVTNAYINRLKGANNIQQQTQTPQPILDYHAPTSPHLNNHYNKQQHQHSPIRTHSITPGPPLHQQQRYQKPQHNYHHHQQHQQHLNEIPTKGSLPSFIRFGFGQQQQPHQSHNQHHHSHHHHHNHPHQNHIQQMHQQVFPSGKGSVSRGKYTGSPNKYYDNAAAIAVPQQDDYAGTDDAYVNQRYAANVGNQSSSSYFYTPVGATAAGATAPEDDDASYYVYDDEEEEVPVQGQVQTQQKYIPQQQTQTDFDYKYNQQQAINPYTRVPAQPQQIITRRPTLTQTPVNPTTTRTATRSRTRTSSSGSSSSSSGSTSSRSRPTLKPKSSIVKQASAPVRDVYLDPPARPDNIYETPAPNSPSTKCKKDLCVLPDCSCGGKEIPGGLRAQETPQIVLLTFDDSVNDLNKNLYRDLFEKGRKNPNGCPISATFYVSHEWTDYSQVQNLAADGHEIASHSVSHSFGEQYSQKKWDREINGQREILAAYGGVKMSEIRGMRAPFLAIGGNHMFKMLHDSNFTYDSSMPIYENRPPSWPYTLDYRIFHDCMIPPCPTKSYPGVWEVPMVMWQDLKGGRCSMGDACSNPPTAEGVYQMLAKNFERHYTTNRAPFGLYYHAAWFTQPHHKEGFEAFLDTLVQMDDVWLVTNWQAIQWIRNPTPNSRILNFPPFSCHDLKDRPPRCNHPKVCNLWHKSGVRYMKTCQQCPQQYPWTGNTGVPYSNSI